MDEWTGLRLGKFDVGGAGGVGGTLCFWNSRVV